MKSDSLSICYNSILYTDLRISDQPVDGYMRRGCQTVLICVISRALHNRCIESSIYITYYYNVLSNVVPNPESF